MTGVPPGLEGEWIEVHSGGIADDWAPLKPTRDYTNAFIWSISDKKVPYILRQSKFHLIDYSYLTDPSWI